MKSLLGTLCTCVFNLPAGSWPFEGYPAWVLVEEVDMPMLCLRARFTTRLVWVNVNVIRTIEKAVQ